MATTNETLLKTNVAKQEDEIKLLSDHFKDNIRILSSIGQFSYILKIRADQYDVSLTLQLDRSYPSKSPDILITAPRLTPEQVSLVQHNLQKFSETLLNRPMILSIYSRLLQWFDENKIQTLSVNMTNLTPTLPSTPRSPTYSKFVSPFAFISIQNRSCPNDSTDQDQCSTTKLIEEVLSRLKGDQRFDKRLIRVGYLDRTVGLQEKVFQDCDFKSESSNSTSMIPKSSIQYFKYGNDLIWDKERKTDLISGPTSGNQQMLEDIINRQKQLIEMMNSHHEKRIDGEHSLSIKCFLPITDSLSKPNYFLSIPLTDPSLIKNYLTYREHFLSTYSSCLSTSPTLTSSSSSSPHLPSNPPHLHLLLLRLRLSSIVQLEQCIQALKRIQEEIHYHCTYPERISLEFRGLDTFFGKTVYIKCQNNGRLQNLRTLITERLCEQQQKQKINEFVFAGNHQDFIPHIILFKSKRRFALLPQHENPDIYFGQQMIDALHLSSFDKQENESFTSHCVFKLDLS